MELLIAVGDELYDRGEDPALCELVDQMMDRLLDHDTSEVADDARATIPRLHHLWCGTALRFDLTIDASDEDDCTAALIRGTLCRYAGVHVLGPAQDQTTPSRSRAGGAAETESVLAVSVSRIRYACPSCTRFH